MTFTIDHKGYDVTVALLRVEKDRRPLKLLVDALYSFDDAITDMIVTTRSTIGDTGIAPFPLPGTQEEKNKHYKQAKRC